MAQRIVITSGGPAGCEAALIGAEYGAEVTVIEDTGMGGSSALWDCVPSKAFVAATGVRTGIRRADKMGLRPDFSQRKIDFTVVNERIKRLAQQQSGDVHAQMEREGIKMLQGRGRLGGHDPDRVIHYVTVDLLEGGEVTLEGDLVLVCTGASPCILPGVIPNGDRILTQHQVYELEELPEHLIVVGSDITGAEFISSFIELGVKAIMVASRDRILPHEDAGAADALEKVLLECDVDIVKNACCDLVERTEDGSVRVVTSDGREAFGSHALMTIGSVPDTTDMGLDASGVKMTPSGHIHADRASRTNVPDVYAAGGCIDLFPLASVAAMQGRTAMYHALGEGASPIRLRTVPSAVFTHPEITTVGVSQAQIESGEVSARAEVLPLAGNPCAKMRSLRHGFVKLFCRKNSGMTIGGAMVAPATSELILPTAVCASNQLTVDDLAGSFSVYPSLSGSITEVARQLVAYNDLEQCWYRNWQHDRPHS